jgi:L-cysteate sulfo-lyase
MTSLLSFLPRVRRSLLPTPFHRLENLSRLLGIGLYCKRDDLTGFGFGGNKTRKMDFLLAAAKAAGATDLVAPGGVQSNFCRIAAAYAARERLGCHLILGGSEEHDSVNGNVRLDHLFGATLHRIHSDDWFEWEAKVNAVSEQLIAEGREPFPMPVGGSSPIGACGYVEAMEELLADAARKELSVDVVLHATSSGGTQAGLLVGKQMTRWPGRVLGMAVAKSSVQLKQEVLSLARRTAQVPGVHVPEGIVEVDDRFLGAGYAVPTGEARKAQELFAREEGIVLDAVYTAKAAAGLIALCREGEIAPGSTAVFIHTGGSPQVFT